ncbi:hypothetical protein BP6252_05462 [Coleophoma cylindrospora]|uniref:Uncharacterized protein n=1 Tax=Coleophoma cylindrospora TaxID=1849047 RepID=A0A3D8RTN3_9HELO|nr:hypothetical protein BP6252_05462 [Coleophoma cylindrospora]
MLILGAGWTSTFLIPLLEEENISYTATSTTGREETVKFVFDPSSDDLAPYKKLPSAETVLITFPLKGKGPSKHLHDLYNRTHPQASARFIQLGSTGIFQIPNQTLWITRHSPYDKTDPRAIAEDELLELGGCVLDLAGLWGGSRMPRTFIKRVVVTKEQLKTKKSLHLIHGKDVARSILALHHSFTPGQRWLLTDLFVYDWFALIMGWGDGSSEGDASGPHIDWVREVMDEEGIQALPRSMEALGRCYDSREFYTTFKFSPIQARV